MLEVKHFPGDMSALEIDRADVKRCLVSGLFEETVKVGDVQRRFYTYAAPGLHSSQPCLVLAPPEDMPVPEYLENSFWLDFAEKNQLFLHILEPENGKYRLDGTDAAYMNRVYVQIQSRQFYVTMQNNIYAVGVGGGAAVAQLPVWMAWAEDTGDNANVCDYWKGQNDADDEIFSNRWADEIYFPSRICKKARSTMKRSPRCGWPTAIPAI